MQIENEYAQLDQLQTAYKVALDEWMAAIREEEDLASVNHFVAEVDLWEAAHFRQEKIRNRAKTAKNHMIAFENPGEDKRHVLYGNDIGLCLHSRPANCGFEECVLVRLKDGQSMAGELLGIVDKCPLC